MARTKNSNGSAVAKNGNGVAKGNRVANELAEDLSADVSGVSTFDLAELLEALQAMRSGDFSVRLPGDWTDLGGKIADTFNDIVAANARMAKELALVGQVVAVHP